MDQAQQIVSLACQAAKTPGWTSQAGVILNGILRELCQNYDFDLTRGQLAFNMTGSRGPYALPADYLRVWQREGVTQLFYTIVGVPYRPTQVDLAEMDSMILTPGLSNFPQIFATDMATSPPGIYFWPPPNGNYPVTGRYQKLMPDIVAPEASVTTPWFPQSNYLYTRLAGELMKLANDDRWEAFLSLDEAAHPAGAGVILRNYLEMKDDTEGRAKTVSLDRRRFRSGADNLRNTKLVGW